MKQHTLPLRCAAPARTEARHSASFLPMTTSGVGCCTTEYSFEPVGFDRYINNKLSQEERGYFTAGCGGWQSVKRSMRPTTLAVTATGAGVRTGARTSVGGSVVVLFDFPFEKRMSSRTVPHIAWTTSMSSSTSTAAKISICMGHHVQ